MRRHIVSFVLLTVLTLSVMLQAQTPAPTPQMKIQRIQRTVEEAQIPQPAQARGAATFSLRPDYVNGYASAMGAWWTNTALVARLGITDEQKTKIENAYAAHRDDLVLKNAAVAKEEAQLTALLGAESIDRNAIYNTIDRLIQARGELERTNSAMTLEMREVLTRAQWVQLPQVSPVAIKNIKIVPLAPKPTDTPAGQRRP